MNCGLVILAAGFGRRFGGDKRQWRLADGHTLLEKTLSRYQGLFSPVLLVLRPEDADWSNALAGCRRVFAPEARLGMGHSLAAGMAALEKEAATPCGGADAAFVALGDMPWVKRTTLQALRQAMCEVDAIVRPIHSGTQGHPVGFGRAYFPELRNLSGDAGAKEVLRRHLDRVTTLAVDDPGVLQDLDRRRDLNEGVAAR